MTVRRVVTGLAAGLMLVLAVASPVAAHKGHAGLTVVEIDRSGTVRVSHRFAAHDVEPALVTVAPDAQPSLDDRNAVAALEDHLGQRFRLDLDGQPVGLTHSGTDLAGDNVRVAFVGHHKATAPVGEAVVDLDFFPGVHDDQEIQVNVRFDGVTRTLVFRPGQTAQTVRFGR